MKLDMPVYILILPTCRLTDTKARHRRIAENSKEERIPACNHRCES